MRRSLPLCLALAALLLAAPGATAHEHYTTDDDRYSIVLGEQNEPVYTYDWTNLDFIVRENATGDPVPGVHETVNATLVAPGGEELALPIEPQFGEEGRYEFVEDYYLTQPGQYEVRLAGHIDGTDVNGTYELPGPRQSMSGFGFPAEDVPTLLDHRSSVDDLRQENRDLRDENQNLRQDVDDLQSRVDALEATVSNLEAAQADGEDTRDSAGPSALATGAAVAAALGLLRLRRD